MGVPEGEVPFAFTWQHVSGKQLPLKGGGVLLGQLGIQASDDLFYTRDLLTPHTLLKQTLRAGRGRGLRRAW